MSTIPASQRIELGPAVGAIFAANTPQSQFLKHYLGYLAALLEPDLVGIDSVVTPEARCHELEAMGLPRGRDGLKMFRAQVNAAIPDEHVSVIAVRFEGADIIEADLVMNATQTGEIFGIPATHRKVRFAVHERCRFVAGMLVERWAEVDIEDIKRQLTCPIQ